LQQLHKTLPPFQPIIPVSLLPYLAFILLTLTFGLAFYFSTLPKGTVKESTVAILASVLGGFGTVAMFCTVGVYV
ncbi:hypothetical protein BDM02DRAFT_3083453, partial [Thelephora ganbajun]